MSKVLWVPEKYLRIRPIFNFKMSYNFSCATFNVKGLGNYVKRIKLNNWILEEKLDVIFLQETHSTKEEEDGWNKDWDSKKVFYSHGTTNSKGVIIMIRKELEFEVIKSQGDDEGRYIILDARIQGSNFILLNIYAPNDEVGQVNLWKDIRENLRKLSLIGKKILIGGDLNVSLNISMDKYGGTQKSKKKTIKIIQEMKEDLDLIDIWRKRNKNKKQFTWYQNSPRVYCRLDYWLISSELNMYTKKCKINIAIESDHKAVTLHLEGPKYNKPGPGMWKLNVTLLKDITYKEMIKKLIEEHIIENKNTPAMQSWEYLKFKIKEKTIEFSKMLAKEKRKEETELRTELNKLEMNLHLFSKKDTELYHNLKTKLDVLETAKAHQIISKAKTNWNIKGEKPNKFFLRMEQANHMKKVLTKVIDDDGKEYNNQRDISKQLYEFFSKHFKKRENDTNIDDWFENLEELNFNRLSEDKNKELETKINEHEILQVIKTTEDGKTPGDDGIPIEFYKEFFNELSNSLLNSFRNSLETGYMTNSQKRGIISMIPKKGKDDSKIQNWRPISLLNVDYKILAKMLATRIKKHLEYLINDDQRGFVPGRYIGESIRKIIDLIDYYENKDDEGLIVSLDIENAFPSISREYVLKALEKFKFSKKFILGIRRIKTSGINNNRI